MFDKISQALTDDKTISMLLIDSSIVKAHQHAAGAQKSKTEDEGIGRSQGGLSSKIHSSVNEQGYPLSIYLSGGQVHDSQYGEALLSGKQVNFVIGDRAYASSKILKEIESLPAVGVIPPHPKAKLAGSTEAL